MTDQFKTDELLNINGDPWRPSAAAVTPKIRESRTQQSYHKGWRVVGHPPGALEKARDARALKIAEYDRKPDSEKAAISRPKAWDAEHWLRAAHKQSVRSKPYEVPEAAEQCKILAEKAGWLAVAVVAISKEVRT